MEIDREPAPDAEVIASLAKSHQDFLRFVTSRVGGDRDLAKEIVQEAFSRGIEKVEQLRNDDSARAWFYRSLRNAIVDHQRRKQSADRALSRFAEELEHANPDVPSPDDDAALHTAVCQCVSRIATTLKPEYRAAIDQVEVEGISVSKLAEREGITPNNAAVRVFRAREALRKRVIDACGTCAEHGCFNCTCGGAALRT